MPMLPTAKHTLALALCLGGTALTISPAVAGQCRDPWVTQAITEVTGRTPNGSAESGDCGYTQYGGGHWNSYAELKGYVQARLGTSLSVNRGSINIPSLPARGVNGVNFVYYNNEWMQIVASGGGNIVASGGGNIVASGGGNIISTNSGGFILTSKSGARIVTNASGNILARSP